MEGDKYNKREQCEKIFPNLTNLEKHLNSSHSVDMPEICLERTANFEIHSQDTRYNSITADRSHQSFYQVSCHQNADDPMTEQFCNIC